MIATVQLLRSLTSTICISGLSHRWYRGICYLWLSSSPFLPVVTTFSSKNLLLQLLTSEQVPPPSRNTIHWLDSELRFMKKPARVKSLQRAAGLSASTQCIFLVKVFTLSWSPTAVGTNQENTMQVTRKAGRGSTDIFFLLMSPPCKLVDVSVRQS